MRYVVLLLLIVMGAEAAQAQQPVALAADARPRYLAEQKALGKVFAGYFYPRYKQLHALPAQVFLAKLDSAQQKFEELLSAYQTHLDAPFVADEQVGIAYYFDKLRLEYPAEHATYAGKAAALPPAVARRLRQHQADLNRPELLANADFKAYVRAYLQQQIRRELRRPAYARRDNQWLAATWQLLPQLFPNRTCREFWQEEYLFNHLDNLGVKNTAAFVQDFNATCQDTAYRRKINAAYARDVTGRQGHVVRTYKTAGPFALDAHLFVPAAAARRPVIVFFHGGSWSEGKPDWFFGTCQDYARRGWVACAVEYRVFARHGTLPQAAVMDAKSAVRWLRQHAAEFQLDTARVVVAGNSAGGHLALCTALATNCNEPTDDRHWSARPNAILVNAGVYDLTTETNAWINQKPADKTQILQISPVQLVRAGLPPMLLIHGTNDPNVPFATADAFRQAAEQAGDAVEFHALPGAGHFIWYDPRYAGQVSELSAAFLQRLGY